jgi:hypothetical protein
VYDVCEGFYQVYDNAACLKLFRTSLIAKVSNSKVLVWEEVLKIVKPEGGGIVKGYLLIGIWLPLFYDSSLSFSAKSLIHISSKIMTEIGRFL